MPVAALPPDTRLLLIDDHQFYLDGLALTLNKLCKGVILEHARTTSEALALVSQHAYDLILLDLQLSDGSGLSLLDKLKSIDSLTPLAILTGSNNPGDLNAALSRDAAGFISKATDGPMLINAIRRLLFGEQVLIAHQSQLLDHSTLAREQGISPRQLEILELLAEGLPNKAICQRMLLSENTVKTHLKAVFAALGCHNRTECVNTARQRGLLRT